MTAVSLLFLLLLAMASFLVYRAVQHITGRFFRLTRAAFQAVCISCAAVFFAAACAGREERRIKKDEVLRVFRVMEAAARSAKENIVIKEKI